MAGLLALSVNPKIPEVNFSNDFFWLTSYLQHLGEKWSGVSVLRKNNIVCECRRGLFRHCFGRETEGLKGKAALGYCGTAQEPFFANSKFGPWSICFSGNIINSEKLLEEFMNAGEIFEKGEDVEIIGRIVAQGETIVDGLKLLSKRVEGAYTVLILTREGIYAALSADGRWPLVLGQRDGSSVLASETGGFDNFGFEIVRDLYPGEIIFLKDGKWEKKGEIPSKKTQICSFLWVYTSFANARFYGVPSSLVRKRLGGFLARRDIEQGLAPHLVMPVPDSGRIHALGYFHEFLRQMMRGTISRVPFLDEHLHRYRFSGRSFTRSTDEKRRREAFIKILKSAETEGEIKEGLAIFAEVFGDDLSVLRAVLCEDSVVRGTQLRQNLVPKARDMGFGEVHVRSSNPEIRSYCPWGMTTKRGEVLSCRKPDLEAKQKFLGVDSLAYNTIDDLVRAIGLPKGNLCMDCALNHE
jgi:amidophosphoribosyltransferase